MSWGYDYCLYRDKDENYCETEGDGMNSVLPFVVLCFGATEEQIIEMSLECMQELEKLQEE